MQWTTVFACFLLVLDKASPFVKCKDKTSTYLPASKKKCGSVWVDAVAVQLLIITGMVTTLWHARVQLYT